MNNEPEVLASRLSRIQADKMRVLMYNRFPKREFSLLLYWASDTEHKYNFAIVGRANDAMRHYCCGIEDTLRSY